MTMVFLYQFSSFPLFRMLQVRPPLHMVSTSSVVNFHNDWICFEYITNHRVAAAAMVALPPPKENPSSRFQCRPVVDLRC
mmetsp:Transcript_15760/g.26383  ORF Transcript_15760/g.26383 Transcript_15760/m.26383 type:complete len:80 (-) Transcript_15760:30-269(-)